MRRVAAVDCGTNSLRLLIAEYDAGGRLVELDRRVEIVRLGQGVDATGEFHPAALARTFAVVDRYGGLISGAGVGPDRIGFVATSASRDVRNRDRFLAGIEERLGVVPEVITGRREAELTFTGALSVLDVPGPVLVTDVGGGSTELITGSAAGSIGAAVSLDLGSVRLTERFFGHSPPRPAEVEAATTFTDGLLAEAGLDLGGLESWIGVAGTVTTLAALAAGQVHHPRRLHGSRLSQDRLAGLLARLSSMSSAELRLVPAVHPGRADVITAGALIATRIGARLGDVPLTVSLHDILDGVAMELLGDGRIGR